MKPCHHSCAAVDQGGLGDKRAVYVPWSSQGYSWGKHHSMKWSSADHDLASTIQWFELWRDELKLPGRPPARRTFSGTTESALSTSLKVHDH
ncbi:hypothetical protein AV530_004306 [Patagioenas fasciata monilis]|uniref:Uncharacterized protein n=1 Tax=Patagioenas fasciata monilis TaxID=372326 RepID=A0A1V4K925_PATFA|nr:hypothetical protein AV530_004306 [Patagioenas fasciata monilis]